MINDWNAFADERCTILKGDGNKGCVMSDDPGPREEHDHLNSRTSFASGRGSRVV